MRIKKRRKIKKNRLVLIMISVIMIVIGGFIVMNKFFFDSDQVGDKELLNVESDTTNKEELEDNTDDNKEVIDSTTVNLEKVPVNNGEYKNLSDGEYLTDKGYTLKIENGVATIDGILIVNKTYSIPSNYGGELTSDVMKAFNDMKAEALALGLNLWIQSGYRSYDRQQSIYNNYVARDGQVNADTYSARAGHSEHQSGLAFDLNTIDDSFTYTDEGKWVAENCYRFGFILRYPKGKENITGYMHESWHLRYVGIDLATKLYNNSNWITMEEYYGISSSY